MNKLTQMYLNRIKRVLSMNKADDELLHEFLVYAGDVDINEVIALLLNTILSLDSRLTIASRRMEEKDEEIRLLDDELKEIKKMVHLKAYEKNQCRMKAGRPIALKGKYSDVLALELQGLSDIEICETLGISRTTLWRYRKQADVDKK